MKKLFICVLSTIMLLSIACLSGCSSAALPDFADCKIGYQLEVYPKVAFDYKISDDCIVHIESITATLTKKNGINAGDLIEEAFYPFLISVIVNGRTDEKYAGKRVSCVVLYGTPIYSRISGTLDNKFPTINQDGTFQCITEIRCTNNSTVWFEQITIFN